MPKTLAALGLVLLSALPNAGEHIGTIAVPERVLSRLLFGAPTARLFLSPHGVCCTLFN
jgi:hypothetical protein